MNIFFVLTERTSIVLIVETSISEVRFSKSLDKPILFTQYIEYCHDVNCSACIYLQILLCEVALVFYC